jgi:hypothetical protein
MREMMRLEVTPDEFDVVQFRRILWQPLDGEPVRAGCEGCQGELAGVDRAIVQDKRHRLDRLAELGAVEPVQLLEMNNEIATALGWTGVDGEVSPKGHGVGELGLGWLVLETRGERI